MNTEISVKGIKFYIYQQIPDIRKYRLGFEVSHGIIYVKCLGAGVGGQYEVDVDMGGKSLERVIKELTPKIISLVKTCKKKSP